MILQLQTKSSDTLPSDIWRNITHQKRRLKKKKGGGGIINTSFFAKGPQDSAGKHVFLNIIFYFSTKQFIHFFPGI